MPDISGLAFGSAVVRIAIVLGGLNMKAVTLKSVPFLLFRKPFRVSH